MGAIKNSKWVFITISHKDSIITSNNKAFTTTNNRDFTTTSNRAFTMTSGMRTRRRRKKCHSARRGKDKYASKVMDAVIDRASKLLTAHFVANKHEPGPLENRVIGQVAGERMCYEAAEIFMNESSPDPNITAEQISDQLFKFVVKAIDAKGPDKGQAAKK